MTNTHEIITAPATTPVYVERQAELHPLVAMAKASGALDIETLRELMQLQREYEADIARKLFNEAMIRLKNDMPSVIAHDTVVDYTGDKGRTHYTHASLAIVMREVVPHLSTHGFSLSWNPSTPNDSTVTVEGILRHSGGHSERCTMSAPPDRKGGKNEAQARASTVTLLSRYTGAALLGIATADMNEVGKPGDENVDIKKNLTALSYLKGEGMTREKAEKFVGTPFEEWTSANLADLKEMIKRERGQS